MLIYISERAPADLQGSLVEKHLSLQYSAITWGRCDKAYGQNKGVLCLTHWGRVTHICVGKLIIIGSDNGLSPDRRQAIIWTNAGLLSIGSLRAYFSENLIKIQQFSLKKMHVKMSSAKWRLPCLGLNVLNSSNYFWTIPGLLYLYIIYIATHLQCWSGQLMLPTVHFDMIINWRFSFSGVHFHSQISQ